MIEYLLPENYDIGQLTHMTLVYCI